MDKNKQTVPDFLRSPTPRLYAKITDSVFFPPQDLGIRGLLQELGGFVHKRVMFNFGLDWREPQDVDKLTRQSTTFNQWWLWLAYDLEPELSESEIHQLRQSGKPLVKAVWVSEPSVWYEVREARPHAVSVITRSSYSKDGEIYIDYPTEEVIENLERILDARRGA